MSNLFKYVPIFTVVALFGLGYLSRLSRKESVTERANYPSVIEDDLVKHSIMAAREDLKLITYLLMGILFFLGVIADLLLR